VVVELIDRQLGQIILCVTKRPLSICSQDMQHAIGLQFRLINRMLISLVENEVENPFCSNLTLFVSLPDLYCNLFIDVVIFFVRGNNYKLL
jgi:hypothetical protein